MTPIVRKILITTASGVITFILTNLTNQPQSWVLVFSILVGGIALIVQYLHDVDKQQQKVQMRLLDLEQAHGRLHADLQHDIHAEVANVNEATELYDRINRSSLASGSIRRLAQLAASLADTPLTLSHKVAAAEIDNAAEFLAQINHGGEVAYEGEDRDWLLALTRSVQKSIDATSRATSLANGSGFSDEGFWDSELSIRYLEWQREAIKRGVAIRRMFVVDTITLTDNPQFRSMCEYHRDIGVLVRMLDASSLTPGRRMLVPDLVIFDTEVSYELTMGSRFGEQRAPYFVKTRLVLDRKTVRDRVRLFDDFWNSAVDY